LGGSNMGLPIFADLSSRRVLPVLFSYFDEPVANADALVEDEAAPVPAALDRGNLLKIGEDAALEVNDILDALAPQEGRRFLAADAAGAEHGNALSREALGVGPPPVRKFAKAPGMRVKRAFKAAIAHLEIVSRVDEHRVRI